jgi:hypothetical protein
MNPEVKLATFSSKLGGCCSVNMGLFAECYQRVSWKVPESPGVQLHPEKAEIRDTIVL